jgi:hypothetical protein
MSNVEGRSHCNTFHPWMTVFVFFHKLCDDALLASLEVICPSHFALDALRVHYTVLHQECEMPVTHFIKSISYSFFIIEKIEYTENWLECVPCCVVYWESFGVESYIFWPVFFVAINISKAMKVYISFLIAASMTFQTVREVICIIRWYV